jgi:hypothetical protein
MRREIVGLERALIAIALAVAIFFSITLDCVAQHQLPHQIISIIEDMASSGGEGAALELQLKYEEMLSSPLEINLITRKQMEECGLLTPFQIESILDYRKEYGDILSLSELSLVDGFGPEAIELVRHFFRFSSLQEIAAPFVEESFSHRFSAKVRKKIKSEGISFTSKYKIEYGRRITAGLTLDSDAGEKLTSYYHPDFTSVHLAWSPPERPLDYKKIRFRKVVLGDYVARFGQGLALWKAFPVSFFGTPSSLIKRGSAIAPYTSTDESNFLRGAGVTFGSSEMECSLFASYNGVDARVVGDSCYTSIITDGLHTTDGERATRNSMHEYLFGGHLSYDFSRLQLGLTALCYGYDKCNARRVREYNKYQMYDGIWGNVALNLYSSWRSFRFFAEAALDFRPSAALLCGVCWNPDYRFETALIVRAYGKGYTATHAAAYSTLSSCSNQYGATASVKYLPSRGWTMHLSAEYSAYPWSRYRIDGPSWDSRARLDILKEFQSGSQLRMRLDWRHKSESGSTLKGRLHASAALTQCWSLSARIEGGLKGFATYGELGFRTTDRRWDICARGTYYNTEDWNSRVYIYERGVPQSFSVENYYGKGWSWYFLVKWSPARFADLWFKYSKNYCAFFILITIPG